MSQIALVTPASENLGMAVSFPPDDRNTCLDRPTIRGSVRTLQAVEQWIQDLAPDWCEVRYFVDGYPVIPGGDARLHEFGRITQLLGTVRALTVPVGELKAHIRLSSIDNHLSPQPPASAPPR